MDLDCATLDEARQAWRTGNRTDVLSATFTNVVLGAKVEAACWFASEGGTSSEVSQRWCERVPAIDTMVAALTTESCLPTPGDHDAPKQEVRRCPSRSELTSIDVPWFYFLDRFQRSLKQRLHLTSSLAMGLSAALGEMMDNVVEHAGLGDNPKGVVAYSVTEDGFSVAVGDLGRGVLASLSDNPEHAGLEGDVEALLAAVTRGASRRRGAAGTGFNQLLRALADMEGVWSFRSGSGRLTIDGRGGGERTITTSNSPRLGGLQLSVEARPRDSRW